MVLKSLLPTFTSVFCTVYTGQELCPVIICPVTLLYVEGKHRALLLAVMGYFHCHPRVVRILSWSCRIIPQSNSPMPVLPTMQSDDVRQENMATGLNIPLGYFCQMLQKKAIYPLNNCRPPGFYGSLFLV